jgi:hypothetical protein
MIKYETKINLVKAHKQKGGNQIYDIPYLEYWTLVTSRGIDKLQHKNTGKIINIISNDELHKPCKLLGKPEGWRIHRRGNSQPGLINAGTYENLCPELCE